jgi:hypothetical protein
MKTLISLGCLVTGLAIAAQPAPVQAGVGVGVGVTVPVGPVYAAPAPAYYAPPPAYYAPAPVYYAPAPVYRPAVVAPGVVVYGRYGRPYYYHRRYWR